MSGLILAVTTAVGAAVLFAASNALRHRSAGDVPAMIALRGPDLAHFSLRTVRHPVWLFGAAAEVAGVALHAVALHSGPLSLVQPLLVSGLVFALPLRQLMDHKRPSRRELAWAALLALGLITFLTVATPASSSGSAPDPVPAAVAAVSIGTAVVACTLIGRRSHRDRAAAATLGAATGFAFAATAALLKSTTNILVQHPVGLLTAWSFYALIGSGAGGLLLNQLAFQAGPLPASLPAISTIDPMASLIIGVAVYDERLRGGVTAIGLELAAVVVVVVATFALSRNAVAAPVGRR